MQALQKPTAPVIAPQDAPAGTRAADLFGVRQNDSLVVNVVAPTSVLDDEMDVEDLPGHVTYKGALAAPAATRELPELGDGQLLVTSKTARGATAPGVVRELSPEEEKAMAAELGQPGAPGTRMEDLLDPPGGDSKTAPAPARTRKPRTPAPVKPATGPGSAPESQTPALTAETSNIPPAGDTAQEGNPAPDAVTNPAGDNPNDDPNSDGGDGDTPPDDLDPDNNAGPDR